MASFSLVSLSSVLCQRRGQMNTQDQQDVSHHHDGQEPKSKGRRTIDCLRDSSNPRPAQSITSILNDYPDSHLLQPQHPACQTPFLEGRRDKKKYLGKKSISCSDRQESRQYRKKGMTHLASLVLTFLFVMSSSSLDMMQRHSLTVSAASTSTESTSTQGSSPLRTVITSSKSTDASTSPFLSPGSHPTIGERRLSPRTVTTKYGSLRGVSISLPNRNLQPVEAFLGIPYAAAPTGKLRLMPPVTPDIWSGIRTVDRPGPVCPQHLSLVSSLLHRFRSSSLSPKTTRPQVDDMLKNETEILKTMTPAAVQSYQRMRLLLQNQSEDCLYLNIYVPVSAMNTRNSEGGSKVPVMVFIPGDSFSSLNGGSALDGSVLASIGNIIVVTINYRLGILDGGTARGNLGLMDQVAALHWIQENIGAFGGDPMTSFVLGVDANTYESSTVRENRVNVKPSTPGTFTFNPSTSGSSSLRSPSQLQFVNGSFQISNDGSKKSDSSARTTSSFKSEEAQKSPGSSSTAMKKDVIRVSPGSELIGMKKSINNNMDEDSSSGGISPSNTNSSSNFHTNALSVVISVGISFLVLNILSFILLLREFRKKDRRRLQRQADKNSRRWSTQESSLSSSSNQLHLIQSNHHHNHRLLNESIDDLCSKEETINQTSVHSSQHAHQLQQPSLSSFHLSQQLQQHQQQPSSISTESDSGGMNGLSFHPELISGHQLPLHQHLLTHSPPTVLDVYSESIDSSIESPQINSRRNLIMARECESLSNHHHQLYHPNSGLPTGMMSASIHVHKSGPRVSASGFNAQVSNNSHATFPTNNHPYSTNELVGTTTNTITRSEGKKVSFLNPSESLILYDKKTDGVKSDTQV